MNSSLTLSKNSSSWKNILAWVVIAAAVLVTFASATQLNFVGDDWIFLDIVGRLNLHDYLIKYFNPYAQTAWYRPVQGIQYLIGYHLFGSDPFGYHLENVLLHLLNCWLLFGVANHVTKRWHIGVITALLYATFPIAVEGIYKAGVIDPLLTTFSLLSVWFWLHYLEQGSYHDYWLAFVNFILALYCKEISIMLPIILFLVDRLYIAQPVKLSELVRRYLWFAVAFVPYVPIEYIVTRRSVFVATEGYSPSFHILSNLIDYFSGLAFPWLFLPTVSYLFLLIALALLAFFIVWKKQFALIGLVAAAIIPILPIVPFPQVSPRFLYFSLTASAFLFALGFDWVWHRLPRVVLSRALVCGVVAVAILSGSFTIQGATAAFAEFSRVSRVTFRNIRQAHPTFPNDTLLYFIDPPVPGPDLSGMFFSRYGSSVVVGANDSDQPARLRDHAAAFVYYFNTKGDPIEQHVEKNIAVRASPTPPIDFTVPIRLEGFELVNPEVKKGEPILLLLYWRALKRLDSDYTVFIHLVDQNDREVAGYEKYPRGGKSPTSTWVPGQRIVDAIVLPTPNSLVENSDYRLEVGMFDTANQLRLAISHTNDRAVVDSVFLAPLSIVK